MLSNFTTPSIILFPSFWNSKTTKDVKPLAVNRSNGHAPLDCANSMNQPHSTGHIHIQLAYESANTT